MGTLTLRADEREVTKQASGLATVLHSMGARAFIVVVNASTGILTARALHPAGRGELAAMGVWPTFLASAMTLGIPSALIFHTRRNNAARSDLVRAALWMSLLLGSLATAAGILAMPVWLGQYSPFVVRMAQLFMLNTPIAIVIAVARAGCEAQEDFFASSVSLCITPLLSLTALVIIWQTIGLTPVSANVGYVIGGLPACAFLLLRLRHRVGRGSAKLLAPAKHLLAYGVRSYGVDLCGTLSLYADQVLVVRLLSPEAMGIYVVALSLSRMLNVVHTAVAAVLFPKVVALLPSELFEVTGTAARMSTTLTAACGLVLACLGPIMLPLLYGHEFRNASSTLNILIAEVVLTGATLVLTQAFMALGRPGLVTILQSSGLLFTIPLLLLLVPRLGVLGASLALLCASVMRLGFTLCTFWFVFRVNPPPLIPRKNELLGLIQQVKAIIRRFCENNRPGTGPIGDLADDSDGGQTADNYVPAALNTDEEIKD
jgi:O-antigen/teichoic acid export membrane protein